MKLKLREKELPPIQLRLVVPATLKERLDQYLAFVRHKSGRDVDPREVAVEMLAQFIESDREFKRYQKRDQEPEVQRGVRKGQGGAQINGHAAG